MNENMIYNEASKVSPVASSVADATARTLADCHAALSHIEQAIRGPVPQPAGELVAKAPAGLTAALLNNQSQADGVLSRLHAIERDLIGSANAPATDYPRESYR